LKAGATHTARLKAGTTRDHSARRESGTTHTARIKAGTTYTAHL